MNPYSLKTAFKITINQIKEGKEYDGRFEIGGQVFQYTIDFLSAMEFIENVPPEEVTCHLRVTKNQEIICLDEDRLNFFYIIVEEVIDFPCIPQVIETNEKIKKEGLTGKVTVEYDGVMHLNSDAIRVLSAPDIACTFPAINN